MTCETFGGVVLDRTALQDQPRPAQRQRPGGLLGRARARARSGRLCDNANRRLGGRTLDRVLLGSNRERNLRRYKIGRRGRGGIDRFCVRERRGRRTVGRTVRVGYPTRRTRRGLGRRGLRKYTPTKAVLILTNSIRFKAKGIRVGSRVRGKTRQRLRRMRSYRVGKNRWYVARAKKARLLFKVRDAASGAGCSRSASAIAASPPASASSGAT